MNLIRHFVKRHPVLSYYALTFLISFGGILLIVGGPAGVPGKAEQIDKLMLPVMLALFAGPSAAGILITAFAYGRQGFRNLGSKITKWRVGARWYAVALLTAPILFFSVSMALSLTSEKFLPSIMVTGSMRSEQ